MTKRERAQVVELLRCAADLNVLNQNEGLGAASQWLDMGALWPVALDARHAAKNDGPTEYLHTLLEAAARVEEGSWP